MKDPPWLTVDGGADVATFAQYGVLGVFAVILLWFARSSVQRERERADRLEDENRQLNATVQDRIIPALLSATNAAEESRQMLMAMQRERERERLDGQRRRHGSDEV